MKILSLLITGIFISIIVKGQVDLVKWNFSTGQLSDTVQNGTNTLNLNSVIRSEGTSAISMTNGQTTGDYAATASGWDGGSGIKNWYISFFTTGYNNVAISSKQRAGGTNGGPKDFKMQYKIGESGMWTDIAGGSITLANNWTGSVNNLSLPAECQNQSSLVYVRWIMSSDVDVNGGTIATNGISKIDEIIVTGTDITGISEYNSKNDFQIYPNPSNGDFNIYSDFKINAIKIYNLAGSIVLAYDSPDKFTKVTLAKGIYFIQIQSANNNFTKRVLIE